MSLARMRALIAKRTFGAIPTHGRSEAYCRGVLETLDASPVTFAGEAYLASKNAEARQQMVERNRAGSVVAPRKKESK